MPNDISEYYRATRGFSRTAKRLVVNFIRRQQNERDEADELLQLLHKMIARVSIGNEQDPHQNVCCIALYRYEHLICHHNITYISAILAVLISTSYTILPETMYSMCGLICFYSNLFKFTVTTKFGRLCTGMPTNLKCANCTTGHILCNMHMHIRALFACKRLINVHCGFLISHLTL